MVVYQNSFLLKFWVGNLVLILLLQKIILVPPQIESIGPQKITKREGEPLILICPVQSEQFEAEAQKESELRITWSKDGRPLVSLQPNYEATFTIFESLIF